MHGDPDDDGLTNLEEFVLGLEPRNPATHGIPDADFVANGGQLSPPDDSVAVPFSVGDPSGSLSERWTMVIQPLDYADARRYCLPADACGGMTSKTFLLKRGSVYRITLHHSGSLYSYPDYDWEATVGDMPNTTVLKLERSHYEEDRFFSVPEYGIVVDNEDGLLGECNQMFGRTNNTVGKEALLYVAKATMTAFSAARGLDVPVPDSEKHSPGCLMLPWYLTGGHPLGSPATLRMHGLKPGYRLSRDLSFSLNGKLVFRQDNDTTIPSAGMSLPSTFGIDQTQDWNVGMYDPENTIVWPDSLTYVDVTYNVRDRDGVILSSDTVRLLRPVVIAIGDSLTYGYMADSFNTNRTPRWTPFWNTYPTSSDWGSLSSPWNDASNRYLTSYQGYRGYLASSAPGLLWLGEETNGHGPRHCGYPGAKIGHLAARMGVIADHPEQIKPMPKQAIETDNSYAIIIILLGMNDATSFDGGKWNLWTNCVESIVQWRENRGRTLFVFPLIPEIVYRSGKWNPNYVNPVVTGYNNSISTYSPPPTGNWLRYVRVLGTANLSHANVGECLDDGLHFNAVGYSNMATLLFNAIKTGLQQEDP